MLVFISLTVSVCDLGRGLANDEVGRSAYQGMGLRSVRDRLAHLGGSLLLQNAYGGGTLATLCVPLRPEATTQAQS